MSETDRTATRGERGHDRASATIVSIACLLGASSCDAPSEAPRVELPVVVDGSEIQRVTTDLGYTIDVTSVRIAFSDLELTIAGEEHASNTAWSMLTDTLVPSAHAHPGHFQGGEVTGELLGEFVAEWPSDEGGELGVATMLAGTYSGSNFTFARGSSDTLADEDPLIGHTAVLTGTATKDERAIAFTIVVDSPQGRELVGAPFEATIDHDSEGVLKLRFHTRDAFEGGTPFDAIDFAELDPDGDDAVSITPTDPAVEDAYDLFRRGFQTHDFYSLAHEE